MHLRAGSDTGREGQRATGGGAVSALWVSVNIKRGSEGNRRGGCLSTAARSNTEREGQRGKGRSKSRRGRLNQQDQDTPSGSRAHAAHLDLSALVIIRVLPVEALGLQRTAVQCHFKV